MAGLLNVLRAGGVPSNPQASGVPTRTPPPPGIFQGPTSPAQAAKTASTQQNRRADYTRGLGGSDHFNVKQLSWDEYDALNSNQRAAVDANSALVSAVKDDKLNGGKADSHYKAQIRDLFGKGADTSTYAPETAKVLQQLGLKNPNSNIGNYTTGSALVDTRALHKLQDLPEGQIASPNTDWTPDKIQASNAEALASSTKSRLGQLLNQGQDLLQGAKGTSTVPIQASQDLDKIFMFWANRDNKTTPDEAAKDVQWVQQTYNIDPATVAKYFQQKLEATRYGQELGATGANNYSPDEFRAQYFQNGGR